MKATLFGILMIVGGQLVQLFGNEAAVYNKIGGTIFVVGGLVVLGVVMAVREAREKP